MPLNQASEKKTIFTVRLQYSGNIISFVSEWYDYLLLIKATYKDMKNLARQSKKGIPILKTFGNSKVFEVRSQCKMLLRHAKA